MRREAKMTQQLEVSKKEEERLNSNLEKTKAKLVEAESNTQHISKC